MSDELAAATGNDPLLCWAADRPGARVWIRERAVAVAAPALSRRDRLPVFGEPRAVAALLRDEVLPAVGPTYRPLGAEALLTTLADTMPELTMAGRFAWMDVTAPVTGRPGDTSGWLPETEWGEVTDLLEEAFPASCARPGETGVLRWAGLRETAAARKATADHQETRGRLLAVAADAWSGRRTGFLAGVATRPEFRGRGHASAVCAFVTNELLADHERVALFADYWNEGAIATYTRLGFDLTPLAVVRQSGTAPAAGHARGS